MLNCSLQNWQGGVVEVARPRGYETDRVVDAALDVFWGRGYAATSVGDLEAGTGLNRSSLYQVFGSKRELYDAALRRYQERELAPLRALEQPGADAVQVRAFFDGLADLFADVPRGRRGCLLVNTTTELAPHDPGAAAAADAYRARLEGAFAAALRGPQAPARAALLTAATLGAFATARADPGAAAAACRQIGQVAADW